MLLVTIIYFWAGISCSSLFYLYQDMAKVLADNIGAKHKFREDWFFFIGLVFIWPAFPIINLYAEIKFNKPVDSNK